MNNYDFAICDHCERVFWWSDVHEVSRGYDLFPLMLCEECDPLC